MRFDKSLYLLVHNPTKQPIAVGITIIAAEARAAIPFADVPLSRLARLQDQGLAVVGLQNGDKIVHFDQVGESLEAAREFALHAAASREEGARRAKPVVSEKSKKSEVGIDGWEFRPWPTEPAPPAADGAAVSGPPAAEDAQETLAGPPAAEGEMEHVDAKPPVEGEMKEPEPPTHDPAEMVRRRDALMDLTVAELRGELNTLKLDDEGKKAELVDRLMQHYFP